MMNNQISKRRECGARRYAKSAFAALALAAVVVSAGPAVAQSQGDFEKQWAELIEAAKKEGRLALSIGPATDFQPVLSTFTKQFGIQIQTSTGSGSARATRVLAERQAGRFTMDVGLLSVAATTRRLEPAGALEDMSSMLFHPNVMDTSKWYGNQHWYVDAGDTKSIFVYTARAVNTWAFWYNTEKVSEADVATLKTPQDFLNPKWRGMMADQSWHDPGRVGNLLEVYFAPDAGPEWVRKYLTEMDVAFTNDPRLEETWLVRGRNPLKWNEGNIGPALRELASKGLPIKEVHIRKAEGTLEARGSECCLVMFKNAPNPNAAKLFANWFLTDEAQSLVHAINPPRAYTSLREDIPPLNTAEAYRRIPGQKYSFRDFDKDYLAKVDEARASIIKTFTDRHQKQ